MTVELGSFRGSQVSISSSQQHSQYIVVFNVGVVPECFDFSASLFICLYPSIQVLVSQGKEPPCFFQLFKGGLIIHKGSREDSVNNTGKVIKYTAFRFLYQNRHTELFWCYSGINTSNHVCDPSPEGWRLFCVRGEAEVEASLVEVDCQRASLRSRASLVLLNAQAGLLYLWHGCKAHASARQVAKRAVDKLTQR